MKILDLETLDSIKELSLEIEGKIKLGERKKAPEGFISSESLDVAKEILKATDAQEHDIKKSFSEIMTSKDLGGILVPKIIQKKMIEGAEPVYLASKFFNKISLGNDPSAAASYIIPVIGTLTAGEVGEGARYPTDEMDITSLTSSNLNIEVKKVGLKVEFTEEAIEALKNWGIIGMNYKKMGNALGRLKEQKCFKLFSREGHTVYDNSLRAKDNAYGTSGRGETGELNDTLTNQDLLEMSLSLISHSYSPTHIIMHPLVWTVFAKNMSVGNGLTFGALGGQSVNSFGTVQGTPGFGGLASTSKGQKYVTGPSQVNMSMPMDIQTLLSREVRFSREDRTFDLYVIDGNEIGIYLEKEKMSNESWTDPERDVLNFKVKERYGIGLLNGGRSIAVAKNIKAATTFPTYPVIKVKTV